MCALHTKRQREEFVSGRSRTICKTSVCVFFPKAKAASSLKRFHTWGGQENATQAKKDELGRGENTLSPSLSLLSDPAQWTQKLLFATGPRNPTSYLDEKKAPEVLLIENTMHRIRNQKDTSHAESEMCYLKWGKKWLAFIYENKKQCSS